MRTERVRHRHTLQGAGLEEEIDSLRAEVERTLAEVRAVHEQNQERQAKLVVQVRRIALWN